MGRVEELLQCVMGLYGAGLERVLETVGAGRRTPPGRRRARRQPAGAPRPAPRRRRHPRAAGARPGAPLPRLARRRRLALGRRRRRRRAPPARGQLRRLPVVGADRQERHRGRDPRWPHPTWSRSRRRAWSSAAPALLQIAPFAARTRTRPPPTPGTPGPRRAARGRWRTSHVGDAETLLVANLDGTLVAYLDRCPVVPARAVARRRSTGTCSPARCGDDVRRAAGRARHVADGGELAAPGAAAAGARGLEGRRPGRRCRMTGLGAQGSAVSAGWPPPRRRRRSARGALRVLRGRHRRAARPRGRPRTTTGCCACAGRATCCSRREGAGGGRYRGVGEDVRRVDDLDARRRAAGTRCGSRSTSCSSSARRRRGRPAARVLPRTGWRHRVAARPARLGRHRRGQPGRSTRSSPTSRRCCCAATTARFIVLPGADRRLLRAGRRGPHARGRGSAAAPEVWQRIGGVLRRARPPRPRVRRSRSA